MSELQKPSANLTVLCCAFLILKTDVGIVFNDAGIALLITFKRLGIIVQYFMYIKTKLQLVHVAEALVSYQLVFHICFDCSVVAN